MQSKNGRGRLTAERWMDFWIGCMPERYRFFYDFHCNDAIIELSLILQAVVLNFLLALCFFMCNIPFLVIYSFSSGSSLQVFIIDLLALC